MRHVIRALSQLSASQTAVLQRGLPRKRDVGGVGRVILVAAAKGGVGKSTVAANLAIALVNVTPNKTVGILDADVFGPSQPILFNVKNIKLDVTKDQRLLPLQNYGVKVMSIGSMIDVEAAVVWRGLMVMSAIERLMYSVEWGNIDCLIIDLPPGTGDVQLSVCQRLNINGAILVTTPQELSLVDVRRGFTMFNLMKIPVLGVVKNMSYFACKCGEVHRPFGDNDIRSILGEDVEILAELPIESSGMSIPVTITDKGSLSSGIYHKLAESIWKKVYAG